MLKSEDGEMGGVPSGRGKWRRWLVLVEQCWKTGGLEGGVSGSVSSVSGVVWWVWVGCAGGSALSHCGRLGGSGLVEGVGW